ncbi:hypothetical protein GTP91_32955 [Rugamonas sp. FT82W]|uniref:Uncharacterized protein n=1 Tax=Duganella vulcania TaxID=2692166 RepID=A0A845GEW7_9BURK|nr:hypothetical protein [Duganella vulcania]MYM91972.1 hypothetical protein [Duganella vulcania]
MRHSAYTTTGILAAAALIGAAMPTHAAPAEPSLRDALAPGLLGLYPSERFKLATGRCRDCAAPEQALWYFNDDMIAVAKADPAGYAPRLRAQEDVQAWLLSGGGRPRDQPPPLVWIGSPHVAEGRLGADARLARTDGAPPLPVELTPKLSTNRSYADAGSLAFFAGGDVKARGALTEERFVVRTLWPKRYAIGAAAAGRQAGAGFHAQRRPGRRR